MKTITEDKQVKKTSDLGAFTKCSPRGDEPKKLLEVIKNIPNVVKMVAYYARPKQFENGDSFLSNIGEFEITFPMADDDEKRYYDFFSLVMEDNYRTVVDDDEGRLRVISSVPSHPENTIEYQCYLENRTIVPMSGEDAFSQWGEEKGRAFLDFPYYTEWEVYMANLEYLVGAEDWFRENGWVRKKESYDGFPLFVKASEEKK